MLSIHDYLGASMKKTPAHSKKITCKSLKRGIIKRVNFFLCSNILKCVIVVQMIYWYITDLEVVNFSKVEKNIFF